MISFRTDWFDLLAVQGDLKSLLQHHSLKTSFLQHLAFFIVQLSHLYITTGNFYWIVIALQCCVSFYCTMKWISHMYVYIYVIYIYIPFLLGPPSHHFHATHYVITECRAELLDLYSSFPLAIYLTHGSEYMLISISQICPSLPFPYCSHVHFWDSVYVL